jgi:DNA polymerase-3 subunit delta'
MSVAALPWHREAWAHLIAMVQNNRLPHAILLTAPSGSGRRQFADALCGYLICPGDTARPCGQCKQCLLYDSGNHPDVMVLAPEESSKNIKIEQVRRAIQFVAQTSNQADATKLIIVQPAEGLGIAAANSLLKNLEEPPGKTLFILIAEPGANLLPTIRSRCQPLVLETASDEQAMAWLTAHSSATPDHLRAALQLAPGRPLHALNLLEQGIPAWRSVLEQNLLDLQQGKISPVEIAKSASTQPALRAIQCLQEINTNACLALSTANKTEALKVRLAFQQKLVPVIRQLSGTSNPNELLALEYVFAEYSNVIARLN